MKCSSCGAPVMEKICPYCGAVNQTSNSTEANVSKAEKLETVHQKSQKAKKPIYKKWWFWLIAALLAISIVRNGNSKNEAEEIIWEDIVLGYQLPAPNSETGQIISNSDTSLSIYIHQVDKEAYKEYRSQCETLGYTIDSDKTELNYSAYNASGYKLTLWYLESSKELHIGLDAPIEMDEFTWPQSTIGTTLPIPESKVGHIEWEAEYGFVINVGETTKEQYDAYVDACMEKGFTLDYNKGDTYYQANNADGYHVSLRYEGNNIMWIRADEPDALPENEEPAVPNKANDTEINDDTQSDSADNYIDSFVTAYNSVAETPITDRIAFDPKVRTSGYYRTEFRLTAWDGSFGENASIGDMSIDIVNYGSYGGFYDNTDLRIYVTASTAEQILDIFPILARVLDPNVSEADIQEVVAHVEEYGDYNGIYISKLSGYILGQYQDNYELMLDVSY